MAVRAEGTEGAVKGTEGAVKGGKGGKGTEGAGLEERLELTLAFGPDSLFDFFVAFIRRGEGGNEYFIQVVRVHVNGEGARPSLFIHTL